MICFCLFTFSSGVGGTQLWRTDGTNAGTVRAFDKNGNDIYINRKDTNARHPSNFGIFGNSLYLSGNVNYENVPIGGFTVQNNDELVKGFNQAVAVYDVDTPPNGLISVVLNVNQGVMVLSNTNIINNNMNKKLYILLSLPIESTTEQSLIFNAFISLGHIVDTVYTSNSTLQSIATNIDNVAFNMTHTTDRQGSLGSDRQTDRIYDILLLSLAHPNDIGGLQITREIRLSEGMVPNATALPIYIFSQVIISIFSFVYYFFLILLFFLFFSSYLLSGDY